MWFAAVELHDVRNIASAALQPAPGVNIIRGPNASGKTSLLEALHLLCVGRSFRVRNPGRVVRIGADQMRIVGRLADTTVGACRLAMQRRGGKTYYRLDGNTVPNASFLFRRFPVISLRPENHSLIAGGPKERRRFLDWSLFHVEQHYFELWKNYHRVLRQRNRALTTAEETLEAWDRRLAGLAADLNQLRQRHAEVLWAVALDDFGELVESDLSLDYYPGWRRGVEYVDLLATERRGDIEQGFTRYGPHRADLIFRNAGREATHVLSRGQVKLLLAAVVLSEAKLLVGRGRRPVLLLDDVFSELDGVARERLMKALQALQLQAFVTTTGMTDPFEGLDGSRVFHVEQGRISPVE